MFFLQTQQMLTYPLEDSVSQIFTSPSHLPTRTLQMVSICQVYIPCVFRETEEEEEGAEKNSHGSNKCLVWNHEGSPYEVFLHKARFENMLGAFVNDHGTRAGRSHVVYVQPQTH